MHHVSIGAAFRWMQAFAEREWRLIFPVALAFFGVPQVVAAIAGPVSGMPLPRTMGELQAIGQSLPAWWTPLLLAILLVWLCGLLATLALALVPRISVGEALTRVPPAALRWLVAAIAGSIALFVLVAMLAAILLIVGIPPILASLVALVAMLAGLLFLLLLLPLALDRSLNPVALVAAGWAFYRRVFLRLAAGIALFAAAAWVVALAVQVALGSVVLLIADRAGARDAGMVFVAVMAGLVTAVEWSALALLLAGIYRQGVAER